MPARRRPYELVVAGPAARSISDQLPEAVAVAVIDFITGPFLDNRQRGGHELRHQLAGIRSARLGTFRALYRVDDDLHEVTVLRIEHRGHVYRA